MIHPDYFAGFPGFYLSSREQGNKQLDTFKVSVYGPKGIDDIIKKGRSFLGAMKYLDRYEIVDDAKLIENKEEQKVSNILS